LSQGFPGKRYLHLLLLGGISVAAGAQQAHVPVQAELVGVLDAAHAKIGDPVFAKVRIKWEDSNCPLQERALLKGRVVAQTPISKIEKTSQLSVLFDTAECGKKDMRPLSLTLAALTAPDLRKDADNSKYQSLGDAPGVALQGGMRNLSAAAFSVYNQPYRAPQLPKTVLPGQVVGIDGLKIAMGAGPEGSTTLSASRRNVRLETGSILVLVKNTNAVVTSISQPPATGAAPAPAVVEPPDQTDVCNPAECNLAVSADAGPATASLTLPVQQLGYTRPADRELYAFDYDSAIAYLAPQKLLFTFNPHLLLARTSAEKAFPDMRRIRAVVLDLQTRKVELSADWHIQDANQYLWLAGQNAVVAHVNQELRLYGPGLKIRNRFALHGPLAFLRISPSGTYFVVGVTQERHSELVHRQLFEAENREPEEDVEVKVLNRDFVPLATATQSSRIAAPVLSEDGQVRATYLGKGRWELREQNWDSQLHVLARVSSLCRPEISSVPPDLLFVVGCDRQTDGKWYRMLRGNGKPVLKGWSPSAELEQTAGSSADGKAFAVAVAKAKGSRIPDAVFRASEIASQRIAVFSSANGQKLFAMSIAPPVATRQTFALSPEGDHLAVLAGEQIQIYSVGQH
jgi:hypothetical protein